MGVEQSERRRERKKRRGLLLHILFSLSFSLHALRRPGGTAALLLGASSSSSHGPRIGSIEIVIEELIFVARGGSCSFTKSVAAAGGIRSVVVVADASSTSPSFPAHISLVLALPISSLLGKAHLYEFYP